MLPFLRFTGAVQLQLDYHDNDTHRNQKEKPRSRPQNDLSPSIYKTLQTNTSQ